LHLSHGEAGAITVASCPSRVSILDATTMGAHGGIDFGIDNTITFANLWDTLYGGGNIAEFSQVWMKVTVV
jgi:hypothetical protein